MSDHPDHPAVDVLDNAEESRFEARIGDELVGILEYHLRGEARVFTHAEVKESWEGKGVASQMAKQSLAMTIEAGHAIVPRCPFIVDYLEKHPGEYDGHLA